MALRELRLRVPRSLIIEVVALPLPLRSAVEGARYCEICFQIGLVFLILGCPPKVVNGATRRSREAVMPKAVDPASPGPAAKPSAPQAPPPGTPLPPSETPS
jgi:hypothetical protein